jgi:hypothetical protein
MGVARAISIQKSIPAIVVRPQHAADVSQYRTRSNMTPAATFVESGASRSSLKQQSRHAIRSDSPGD